jgi:phage terminase small subunit
MNDKMARFVREIVRGAPTASEAARRAGYNDPGARAWELLRKPNVQAAIRVEQIRLVEIEGPSLALGVLMNILRDETLDETLAGRKLRADVANKMLDRAGYSAARAATPGSDAKSLGEMSVSELEEFIRKGREAQSGADRPQLEAPAVEVTEYVESDLGDGLGADDDVSD